LNDLPVIRKIVLQARTQLVRVTVTTKKNGLRLVGRIFVAFPGDRINGYERWFVIPVITGRVVRIALLTPPFQELVFREIAPFRIIVFEIGDKLSLLVSESHRIAVGRISGGADGDHGDGARGRESKELGPREFPPDPERLFDEAPSEIRQQQGGGHCGCGDRSRRPLQQIEPKEGQDRLMPQVCAIAYQPDKDQELRAQDSPGQRPAP